MRNPNHCQNVLLSTVVTALLTVTAGCASHVTDGRSYIGDRAYSTPDAIVTTFYFKPLRGSFQWFSVADKAWKRGTISRCEYATSQELRCWWTSGSSQGPVHFRFSDDNLSFEGLWEHGAFDTAPSYRWSGKIFAP